MPLFPVQSRGNGRLPRLKSPAGGTRCPPRTGQCRRAASHGPPGPYCTVLGPGSHFRSGAFDLTLRSRVVLVHTSIRRGWARCRRAAFWWSGRFLVHLLRSPSSLRNKRPDLSGRPHCKGQHCALSPRTAPISSPRERDQKPAAWHSKATSTEKPAFRAAFVSFVNATA